MITKLKKFSPFVLFLAWILVAPAAGATTYFLSPSGSDSNSGTSAGSPWASPNHSVNCGDVIQAAAGTYSQSNFYFDHWGSVSCPAGNNVAWVICTTFDTCKINGNSGNEVMAVSRPFWGVQGWEVSASGTYGACFVAAPDTSITVHHVIFANDIANGCGAGGFGAFPRSGGTEDYIVYVGDIAYNGAQSGSACYSGFNIFEPKSTDTNAGTHIYVAGNFGWSNVDANPCAGTAPTDGEGVILDTISANNYNQQIVVANNIMVGNGGPGVQPGPNSNAGAPIYFYNNTVWGNNVDSNRRDPPCGELKIAASSNVTMTNNLAVTATNSCFGGVHYAFMMYNGSNSDSLTGNWLYSAASDLISVFSSGSFSAGSNITGSNPGLANPSIPGPPNCGSATSVPNCMAPVIANFAPANAAARAYGYQTPTTGANDPLFPQWLCNVNLPTGLVTMSCGSTGGTSAAPQPPAGVRVLAVQ